MADVGRELADRELRKLERKLSHEYAQAEKELRKKREEFTKEYQKELKKKKALLEKGELTKERYKQWLEQQALYESWVSEMADYMASEQVNANRRAAEIMNNATPKVYAEAFNFGTFMVEDAVGIDTMFTLYNADTVARLVKGNPKLLPEANIDVPKDKRWNYQKMKTSLVQSVLQGESVSKMAKRLRRVTDMNKTSAIRNARTMFVGAENSGRFDSFQRAIDLGIEMKKMWSATMDNRTRNSHAILDGETVELNEKFSNGLMYPGDPDGAPSEVYNCRCRLSAQLAGFERNNRHIVNGENVTEEQYLEWKRKNASQGDCDLLRFVKDRSEDFFKVFGERGTSHIGSDAIGREIESALVQLQEKYPMQQRGTWEFRANVDNIVVVNYQDAWLYLPDGIADRRLDYWAMAQVFQNDIEEKNQAVVAFSKELLSKDTSIDDVLSERRRMIAEGKELLDLTMNNPTAVAIHEWGHIFTEHMTSAMFYDDPDAKEYWKWYRSLSKEDIKKGISIYAAENRGEFEAECFLELQMPNPRPLAVKWWSYMKKVVAKGY